MSFHIDILWVRDQETGEPAMEEFDYSINDCVENGWLDPETSLWLRELILPPNSEEEFIGLPCRDPHHREDLKLRLQKINGIWRVVF